MVADFDIVLYDLVNADFLTKEQENSHQTSDDCRATIFIRS